MFRHPTSRITAGLAISMRRWIPTLVLAIAFFASAAVSHAAAPQIDGSDQHRFVRGIQPWYPVGYTPNLGALTRRCDGVALSQYYPSFHTWLQSRGINYYRAVFTFGQPFAGQAGDACRGRLLTSGSEETLPYKRTGPGLAKDGRQKFNLNQWNNAHFNYWKDVIEDAAAKGIVIELTLFDSFHNNKITHTNPATRGWGQLYDFYHGDNNINGVTFTLSNSSEATWHNRDTKSPIFQRQKALVQKVALELGGYDNVIFEICNEPDDYVWASNLGIYLASNRPVVQRDLLDHKQTIPNGQHDHPSLHATLASRFNLPHPLVAHNDCVHSSCLNQTVFEQRQRAWAALTAGGHYNHLFNLDARSAFNPGTTADQGARYLGYAGKFINDLGVNLRGMVPSDLLVTSPVSNGAWAFARNGQEYVVYKRELANNRSVTISTLSASHQAKWFDPRSGNVGPTAVGVASGNGYRFTPPSNTARDWVLHVVVTPMPEIRVIHGGIPITDGGSFTFLPSPYLDQLPTSRKFFICNDGNADLRIFNRTSLVSGAGFSQILNPSSEIPASTIAAQACTGFRVRLNVSVAGTYTGTVSIQNNDQDENPFNFTITAVVRSRSPEIRVIQHQNGALVPDGGVFDFGSRTLAQLPTSRLFDICNDGVGTLTISNPTNLVSGFGFSQIGTNPATSIAPNTCTNFRARFHVNLIGTYTGAVSIINNDSNENPYNFTLRGTATN